MKLNNKKILITGHQGFIGSWTISVLATQGAKLIGIDDKSSYGTRLYDAGNLSKLLETEYICDISDIINIEKILRNEQPDIVINLAGQAIVPRAFDQPFLTYRSNTLGTLSLLEASSKIDNIKSIICITSDKVYENTGSSWPYREIDQLGGKDVYSVSKSSAELLARCFALTHSPQKNIQTIRLGNVVGGGDWSHNRLIPDLIRATQGEIIFKVRYPHATRPFQYILDVIDGIKNIAVASFNDKISSGDTWNLGPKNNTYETVSNVIKLAQDKWPSLTVEENTHKISEDIHLAVDVTKYSRKFSPPKYESLAAIQKTLMWYKNFYSGKENVETLINNEIKEYYP